MLLVVPPIAFQCVFSVPLPFSKMRMTWTSPVAIFVLYTCITTSQAVFEANKCLSENAFYNDTSLQCQCNEGYKGLGDLCCDDDNAWSNCNIGGDPWLSTFDGTQSSFNWPCVSRIAVATGTTGSGNECTVEVMTSATSVERGAVYTDKLAVAFTIDGGDKNIFRVVGNTIKRPGDSVFYRASDLYRRRLNRVTISGERIFIDFVTSRHIWTIKGCHTKITFRAAQNTDAIQYNRPGVCFSVSKTNNVQPSGLAGSGDVCSYSQGQGSIEQLPYTILTHVLKDYTMVPEAARAIHPAYQQACASVSSALGQECNNNPAKIDTAVRACAAILYHPAIKTCMSLAGTSGSLMVGLFSACVGFQCNPRPVECNDLVGTYLSLQTCFPSFCRS